jgi:hypothetical protein
MALQSPDCEKCPRSRGEALKDGGKQGVGCILGGRGVCRSGLSVCCNITLAFSKARLDEVDVDEGLTHLRVKRAHFRRFEKWLQENSSIAGSTVITLWEAAL